MDDSPLRALSPAPAGQLPTHLTEIFQWAAVANGHLTCTQLAGLIDKAIWWVEGAAGDLVALGACQVDANGFIRIRHKPRDLRPSDDAAAHAKVASALPTQSSTRLFHILRANEAAKVETSTLTEAIVTARARAQRGQLGAAVALLAGVHQTIRRAESSGVKLSPTELFAPLFTLWVEAAIADWTPEGLDRVCYEISREEHLNANLAAIRALAQAALALWTDGKRALQDLEHLPPFSDPNLERRRFQLMMVAARAHPTEVEERVLTLARAWVEKSPSDKNGALLSGLEGRFFYRQGDYNKASEAFLLAAANAPWETERIAYRINAGSALLEAFRLSEARWLAHDARTRAAECRHAFLEARAEWLMRAAAYRMREPLRPDLELTQVIEEAATPDLAALVWVTEAAFAYRIDDHRNAVALSKQAISRWSQAGIQPGAVMLFQCLCAACGEPFTSTEMEDLCKAASACELAELGLQALGLLAIAQPQKKAQLAQFAKALTDKLRPLPRDVPLEVLSIREAIDAVGGV